MMIGAERRVVRLMPLCLVVGEAEKNEHCVKQGHCQDCG